MPDCKRQTFPQGTDALQAAQATQDSDKKRKTKGKPIQRAALAGKEHVMAAYEEAVKERYRFFSFGDAMFIR